MAPSSANKESKDVLDNEYYNSSSSFLSSQPPQNSSKSGTSGGSARTPPNCAKCRNHYLKIPLRGHKRHCKYDKCKCKMCELTENKRDIMAKEIKLKRHKAQDEALGLIGIETTPPLSFSPSLNSQHFDENDSGESSSMSEGVEGLLQNKNVICNSPNHITSVWRHPCTSRHESSSFVPQIYKPLTRCIPGMYHFF